MNTKQTRAEVSATNNTFNHRKFASIFLVCAMAVLWLAAITIKVADAVAVETFGTGATTIHIVCGVIFVGFIIAHTKINHKAMNLNATTITLITSMIVMVVSAGVIQYGESSGVALYELVPTVIHVLSGIVFTGVIAIHLKKNWKTFKSYVSKEVVYGLCVSVIPIIVGIAFAVWNPKK